MAEALAQQTATRKSDEGWHSTACILCALNCGVKVQLTEDGREIARTKGDENHPASGGYLCNKASRLNFYQNRKDRLLSPMRRTPEGTYEEISWDTAITEIAGKLSHIKDTWGGDKVFYYGGGGQGNHLPGAYARTTLATLGARRRSNALAQEKTGEFWVAQRLFGAYNHGDFEHAQVTIFLGKNPWQSHGFHRARAELREIAKDDNRKMIVIDPKRTETADMADIHLAVKPGRDAFLLAALAAAIVQNEWHNAEWLATHTTGSDKVLDTLRNIDVAAFAHKAGIDIQQITDTAQVIAEADSVACFEDLGVQMNRYSTLVSYLQRVVWLLGGNFAKPGTHYTMNGLGKLGEGSETGTTPVTGAKVIAGLTPCTAIPDEVLTDHPERIRAMIVESGNPVHSLPDSGEWRKTMRALECSVVIDVAMTETALEADYVLPTSTQYEKAEATFFNFEFPNNYFHVRQPLFTAPDGVLDEAEIHMRLAQAMGGVPEGIEEKLLEVLQTQGRVAFREAVFAGLAEDPSLMNIAPGLLYRTLGKTLPNNMANAATLWAVCHQHAIANKDTLHAAGIEGEGMDLGDNLFDALINSPSGVIMSSESWDDIWSRAHDGKVNFALDDLLEDIATLHNASPSEATADYPFLLSAGERRAFTANTIIRNPDWRRKDAEGALFINPDDAARLNLGDGSNARLATQVGELTVTVEVSDRMARGHVSIPNGMGLVYPDENGNPQVVGPSPNELTWNSLADEYVGTPWHKTVPARIEAVE